MKNIVNNLFSTFLAVKRISAVALAKADAFFILFMLLPSLLFAQVYTGGSYDGYDNGLPGVLRFEYPQVVSVAATNVTDQSAWLNGTLLSTGSAETVVWVYWGAANCGTNKTAWAHEESFGVCTQQQSLTTNALSLTSNTVYYYSFYASNAVGEHWSATTVKTLGPPVLDAGLCAAPVSRTGARLNGALTNGTSADIKIYFGQNTNNWASTNSLGTRVEGTFYVNVSGLTAGSVYYYRCYGTNTYGECWADTIAFTTQVDCAGVFLGGSYDGYDEQFDTLKLGAPVVDNDGGASSVAFTNAVLNGNLVSTGSAPTCVWMYRGTSDGGMNKSGWDTNEYLGEKPEGLFSTDINGLTPGFQYYYRCYASNAYGDAWAWGTTNFMTRVTGTIFSFR